MEKEELEKLWIEAKEQRAYWLAKYNSALLWSGKEWAEYKKWNSRLDAIEELLDKLV